MNPNGVAGESAALNYLRAKGYRWLASNFSTRWGEIDLIMEDGAVIVFIEVKHRRNKNFGEPEEAVTPYKQRHIEKVAMMFIQKNRIYERMMRFDVIVIGPDGLKHHENAFMTSGIYY